MLSFAEFIIEANRSFSYYRDWGLIHPSGKLISGPDHPTATSHEELSKAVARRSKKYGPKHYAEYADEIGGGLSIRTYNNHHSVGAAAKGLKHLSSSTGEVSHDYETHYNGMPEYHSKVGSEPRIAGHLRVMYRRMKAEDAEQKKRIAAARNS